MDDAHASGPSSPPPKLSIDRIADGDIECLRLSGTLDEGFDGRALASGITARTVVLDLGRIGKISSFGIREWIDFLAALDAVDRDILFVECAPKIIDQLNMVGNFAGSGRVYSFYAPYRCDYCDQDRRALMQVDRDRDAIRAMKPPERACEACGEAEYFDEDPVTYFSYVAGQPAFSLSPEVSSFLAGRLSYRVDGGQRLRVDKVIEGHATHIALVGGLDKSFPRDKLAEGLEGTVIVDLAGVGTIDPAGAAEWRGFLHMITPAADAIYLVGASQLFLEKLTRPADLGIKAQVLALSLPYTCARCSKTTSREIDVVEHFDLLKFATPPDLACGDCGQPAACTANELLLSQLASLPAPAMTEPARALVQSVREAARESRRAASEAARDGRPSRPPRRSSQQLERKGSSGGTAAIPRTPWLALVAVAVIAAALTAGGIFAYWYWL